MLSPRATEDPLTVTESLTREELSMFVRVLSPPSIDLFVKV
jgi:hypothetical protein